MSVNTPILTTSLETCAVAGAMPSASARPTKNVRVRVMSFLQDFLYRQRSPVPTQRDVASCPSPHGLVIAPAAAARSRRHGRRMSGMGDFEAAAGAVWASRRITEDFPALCACGGGVARPGGGAR